MKSEDLMIGDWVNLYDNPIKINIDDLGAIDRDETYDKGVHCKPILLTTEILEKNGFKEDSETNGIYWRPDCRKFCIVKELDTWYFAFRVLGETVDKSPGYICISECNYVHKLQHILKDLEIGKEIAL